MSNDPLQSDRCAEMLKALGEPYRIRIIDELRAGPANVSDLADRLGVEVVTISHHLNILFHAGIVDREKQGRFVVYSLREGILSAPSNAGKEHIDLGCCRLEIPRA